jgi:acetylglutamate kinase
VFAPLTHADGKMLNTNADTIASVLAVALSKHFDVRLIFCFEKKGVLKNVNDAGSVITIFLKNYTMNILHKGFLQMGFCPSSKMPMQQLMQG